MQTSAAPVSPVALRDDPHLLTLPWVSAGRMRLLRGDVLRFRPDAHTQGLQVAVFEWLLSDGACRRVTLGVHQRHADDWLQADDDALVIIDQSAMGTWPRSWATAPDEVHGRVRLTEGGGFAYRPTPGFIGREAFAYLATDQSETLVTHVTISLRPPLN